MGHKRLAPTPQLPVLMPTTMIKGPSMLNDNDAPLDMAVLTALFGDDRALCFSILDDFSSSMEDYRAELAAATDLTQVRAVAHKLKSSARTVGAGPLADICAALELACRAGQQSQAEQLRLSIGPEMVRVNKFLAGLVR